MNLSKILSIFLLSLFMSGCDFSYQLSSYISKHYQSDIDILISSGANLKISAHSSAPIYGFDYCGEDYYYSNSCVLLSNRKSVPVFYFIDDKKFFEIWTIKSYSDGSLLVIRPNGYIVNPSV